jgi:hypothetical protein
VPVAAAGVPLDAGIGGGAVTARTVYRGDRAIGRRRMARKTHTACWDDCPPIKPGEVYLEVVEYPGGDSGYATAAKRPVRMRVCAYHAGHDDYVLYPMSDEQANEVYLRHARAGNG